MNSLESRQFPTITTFLRQETVDLRGKNTCYATSILNAAIALGALGQDNAELFHQAIIDELIANPTLWRGSDLHINTLDPRIAEIIEKYLPVYIGFEWKAGRLITVRRDFQSINRDLSLRAQAHVITSEAGHHSYAAVASRGDAILYIDPMDPKTRFIVNEAQFNRGFCSSGNSQVITTPVRLRPKT